MKTRNKQESERNVMKFFSSLADETRLHILMSMAESPKTVNDIYTSVGRSKLTLSAISHQLRQMSDLGIVEYEKKGREKFYKLSGKFCWCILRDALGQFGNNINIKCEKCKKERRHK